MSAMLVASWQLVTLMCQTTAQRQKLANLHITAQAVVFVTMTSLPVPITLFCVWAIGVAGLAANTPTAGVYLAVTALVPIFEYRIAGVLGLTTFLTLNVPTVMATAILAVRLVQPSKFIRQGFTATDWWTVVFVVALVAMSSRGLSSQLVIRAAAETTLMLGVGYIAGARARLPSSNDMLLSFAFIGLALGLLSIFEALRGWPIYDAVYSFKGQPMLRGMGERHGFMRSVGPFSDPLAFSIVLASAALATFGYIGKGNRRSVAIGVLCGILMGLACTFARTGLVAFAIGMLVFAVMRRQTWIYAAMIPIAVTGYIFLNAISAEAAGTADYRMKLLNSGLNLILQHPLTGDNMAVREGRLDDLLQGQGIVDLVNTYIQLGVEGGLLLIICFLLPPLVALSQYLRRRRRLRESQRIMADVAASQLLGMLAALVFTSLTDKNLLYLMFTTGFLSASLAQQGARNPFRRKYSEEPGVMLIQEGSPSAV